MERQVQELIDKIKKDGVESAQKNAKEIIEKAQEEARKIVEDARRKAEETERHAEKSAENFKKAGEESLKQASRNVLISFRNSLLSELNALIKADIKKVYSAQMLKETVPLVIKEWAKKSEADELSVLIGENEAKETAESLMGALSSLVKEGLTVKSSQSLDGGFRVGVKNGEAYYDYSAEAVASLLGNYVNPHIASIMKEAAKSEE